MGNRQYHSREWLYTEYILLKKSARQIANEISCDTSTVTKWLKKHGIHQRTLSESCVRTESQRRAVADANRRRVFSEESRRKLSIAGAGRQHTEEEKHKISAANKGKPKSKEHKKKLAELRRGTHASEETKRKFSEMRSGPKNPQWRGGKSYEPYCYKFNESLKESIRNDFGRSCFICGAKENGRRLQVHHVDYSKLQGCKGQRWALIPLCISCHGKTCHDRWYWFNLLIHYWAMDPGANFNSGGLYGTLQYRFNFNEGAELAT